MICQRSASLIFATLLAVQVIFLVPPPIPSFFQPSCVQASTDWPVFFEHLGRVHSIHNKWELTFAVKTNFGHFEQKLLNISRRIDSFELEEPTVEFVEDERKEEETKEDRIFRLVNEHWDGLASLLRRRSNALLHRLRDYRSDIFQGRHSNADADC